MMNKLKLNGSLKVPKCQKLISPCPLSMILCKSEHPDSREIINRGDMIPDTVVGELLLEALLVKSCNSPECGVLVDGFPRTSLQVGTHCASDGVLRSHSLFNMVWMTENFMV